MTLNFTKMNGLGNDFVFADNRDGNSSLAAEQVVALCDRHFGVGADGVMLIEQPYRPGSDFSWHFVNADGSVAEMCGNGIRCAAVFLDHHGLIGRDRSSITIDTLAGPIGLTLTRDSANGAVSQVTVDMGVGRTEPAAVPTTVTANAQPTHPDGRTEPAVLLAPLTVPTARGNYTAAFTGISMGNPHAVFPLDLITGPAGERFTELSTFPLSEFGPAVQALSEFPASVNVEVATQTDVAHLQMRVWERGVGETLACGTGACAVALSYLLNGTAEPTVDVALPGGHLSITVRPTDGHIIMTGPATVSFDGTVELGALR